LSFVSGADAITERQVLDAGHCLAEREILLGSVIWKRILDVVYAVTVRIRST
jgi:hypothetical protein